jgi:hypothetical protein
VFVITEFCCIHLNNIQVCNLNEYLCEYNKHTEKCIPLPLLQLQYSTFASMIVFYFIPHLLTNMDVQAKYSFNLNFYMETSSITEKSMALIHLSFLIKHTHLIQWFLACEMGTPRGLQDFSTVSASSLASLSVSPPHYSAGFSLSCPLQWAIHLWTCCPKQEVVSPSPY